jgi:L-ribulose-5-phosphate 3-epimerase UlaE
VNFVATLSSFLDYVQTHYPKAGNLANWTNPVFTGLALTIDFDLTIKVLAFLFVTLPLGIVQWGHAVKFLKERRAKKNVSRD